MIVILSVSRQEAARELLNRRKARNNLIDFTRYTMPGFEAAEHHKQICGALEKVSKGEINRLMIFAPPRHTKSELASRRFPAWYLGQHPDKQIISTTYGHDFAADFGQLGVEILCAGGAPVSGRHANLLFVRSRVR